MNENRTIDDYQHYNAIAAEHEMAGYHALSIAFADDYKEQTNAGNAQAADTAKLLSDVCSLHLHEEGAEYVYRPGYRFSEGRSATIDEFSEEDLEHLKQILPHLTSHVLKARIEDILRERTKAYSHARNFVVETMQIPLQEKGWNVSFREHFSKALLYSIRNFRKEKRFQQYFEQAFADKIQELSSEDCNFALSLSDSLLCFRLSQHCVALANKFEAMGNELTVKKSFLDAENCYAAASAWQSRANNEEAATKLKIKQAESKRLHGYNRDGLVYRGELQAAILILKSIKREYKEKLSLWGTIRDWEQELDQIRPEIFDSMSPVRSGDIDITPYANGNRDFLSGKTKEEALKIFPLLQESFKIEEQEKFVLETIQKYPLIHFFNGTYYGKGGRQIAELPSIADFNNIPKDHPQVLLELYRTHSIHSHIQTMGLILPCLDILHLEHEITLQDFADIVYSNPFITDENKPFLVRGLYAGYHYDFALSLHFLAPQLEQMFRTILQAHGVTTIYTDTDKKEDEKGLNAILKHEIIQKLFDENILFEIEVMFCNPLGANIRNNIAHGLVGYSECSSPAYIYAWWLVWRLLRMMHEHHTRQPDETEDQSQTE